MSSNPEKQGHEGDMTDSREARYFASRIFC